MSRLTLILVSALMVSLMVVNTEARSVNALAQLKTDFIEAAANTIVSFVDRNLGRQTRSLARSLFGIENDEAMKALFVKLLEFFAYVIGELVFSPVPALK